MTDEWHPDRGFKACGPEEDKAAEEIDWGGPVYVNAPFDYRGATSALTPMTWKRAGIELARRHDATVWDISDWYRDGQKILGPGECRRIVEAQGWQGVKYDTIKVYACVGRRYPPEFRYLNTSPAHYHSARVLPLEQSIPLLTQAAAENWNLNKLRIAVRRIRWFKPLTGGDVIDDLYAAIRDGRKWRGIDADPPWQWDSAGGYHSATTQHYPTMPLDELCALPVGKVACDDAFLFLWVPPALLMTAGRRYASAQGQAGRMGNRLLAKARMCAGQGQNAAMAPGETSCRSRLC
jgi:hypothetical protein